MWAVSDLFLSTIRAPHKSYGYVEAWYAGTPLTFQGSRHLPLTDGSVTVDGSTTGPRRTLSVTLAPERGLWDFLAPNGTELRAYTVLEHLNETEEVVPQGVFPIDSVKRGYATNGDIRITAPDRWVQVQNARFLVPQTSTPGISNRQQIAELILGALPGTAAVTDLGSSGVTVPLQTWDRDRDKAIQELAKAASLDVFFDRSGNPVIRDAPTLGADPAWTVDASETGVLISADRERNRQQTYNLVVVTNDAQPFWSQLTGPVYVWDNNPNSPTYAGAGSGASTTPPDPLTAGPFGQRPTFYSSPLLENESQAAAAGRTVLERTLGLAAQLSLTSAPNPALDDGDTITVKLPPEGFGADQPLERHLVDKLVVPLRPDKGAALQIDTRSTAADLED